MNDGNLNISWDALWKLFLMVLLAWILFLARDVIAALLLAIIISSAFDPIVSYMERKKIPRILGTLFVYLCAAILVGFILYTFIPIALTELNTLLKSSSEIVGPSAGFLDFREFVEPFNINLTNLNEFLFSGGLSFASLTSKFVGGFFFAITIFALSFYLTVGSNGVEKFLEAMLPAAYEKKAIQLYSRVSIKIGRWLSGQLFISLILGIITFLGLWLLGVRYAFFLSLLAAVAALVPYVGPIFTGAIAVLVGLSESISLGIYVLLLFVVIQQLEGNLLVPAVMRYTTALNPVVILSALLIGGKVFGVIGLISAVPVAVFFQELLENWAETKQSRRGLMI
jgi:predicted PurR-regulated permease PerM